jgi:diguanylate cyclase (GGDEF)-like protein
MAKGLPIAVQQMTPGSKVPGLRTLVVCALGVIAVTVLGRGIAAWTFRTYFIEDASRDVGHIAAILADETAKSVKSVDQSLAVLQERLIDLQGAPADHFQIAGAQPPQAFSAQIARLPAAADFAIVDAQGHVLDRSKSWPDQDLDVSGREFFAQHSTGRRADLAVNPVPADGSRSEETLLFSRRVESGSGEFLGVVAIRIGGDTFRPPYPTTESLKDLSFALVRTDGAVLVRYPGPAGDAVGRAAEKMPAQSPWYATVAAGGGLYRSSGEFDDQARLVAVSAVPSYPLVVDAGELESIVLAPWQRIATMIAVATVLTLVCIAFLLRILVMQFRNLAVAQTSLAARESELKNTSSELASAHTRIDAALNNMSQGLCMFDKNGQLVVRNERYLRIYAMPSDAAKPGARFVDMLKYKQRAGDFSGDPQQFAAELCERLAQGQMVNTTHQLADGRIIEVANEPMIGGGWVATHDDITERQRNEARIARMARYDSLTDLANRVLFREKADAALESYNSTGVGYSILLFDLDLFKSVNDSLGHPVGDALLKAVATRLKGLIRETDTVGRIGGDEFAILHIAAGDQRDGAADLAQRLLEAIGAPYEIEGHNVVIGTSVGIAMAPDHGTDNEKLLKNADLALYRAKSDGRNSCRFFEPEMDHELRLRRMLEVDLNCAISNGEFEAHYQPLVNAEDGRTCAMEALVRWRHPRHGLVPPGRFIPVAEERGLITAIDRWMLHRACSDAVAWPDHIRVAVNLSPIEFRSGDLLAMITDALARSGLAPARLELEITESVLLQKSERNILILHQIKKLGVSIVLDDFGTGYSSLGYLRMFPFDKIKIDQSFVREMRDRADCAAIVCAIANLGRELNMVTVAEGVETSEQLALVRAAGCTQVQGFLFSRPLPAAQLTFSGETAEPRRSA